MKTRTTLVSNSSTSSFILIGWQLKPRFVRENLSDHNRFDMTNVDEEKINDIVVHSPHLGDVSKFALCLYNTSCCYDEDHVLVGFYLSNLDNDKCDISMEKINNIFQKAIELKDKLKHIVIEEEPALLAYLERV